MSSKLVQGALLAAAMLVAAPAFADRDRDESGNGRWRGHHGERHHGAHEGKEEFWDGHCKVKRKWKGDEYKEERKCRSPRHASAQPPPEPGIVISLPPIVVHPSAY